MSKLPLKARLYIGLVIGAGACLLALLTPWSVGLGLTGPSLFFSLLLISTFASAFKVELPVVRNARPMSVSSAVDFAAMLLIGPNLTMLISALGAWARAAIRSKQRNPAYRLLFNMAVVIVTVQAAGHTHHALSGVVGGGWAATWLGLAGAIIVYFLANTLLMAIATGLSTGNSWLSVWQHGFSWNAPSYFIGGTLASAAFYLLDASADYFALLAAIPLYLTYRAYGVYVRHVEAEQKRVQQISNLHLATVEALALAVDAKDQRPHSHIRRMQVYAAETGKALGMTPHEIDGIRMAGLLHDIGKLAVPEHILSKPGALTEEEIKKVRVHPVVGAEVIAQVPFPYPVAPLILCHHERWDGRGYPAGLKGEEIPLGARVLAVIDFYDALISDRPYHPAMSQHAAAQLVRQESGRAFDPTVAEAFLKLLPDLPALVESSLPSLLNPRIIEGLSPKAATTAPSDQTHVLEHIALAHREIYALYEIAQVMGTSLGVNDTIKVVAAKLSSIVPFSCFALYLYNQANDTLLCRFASGIDADIVRRVIVKNGHGMSGWVARNRRPLVNARPNADLEASNEGSASTRLQSALVSPLVCNDEVIGTLAAYHVEAGFYTEDHCRLLDRVCEQAAAVIANSITFEKTQQESLTDNLTGLPNARHLLMHLERELARAERLKSEVAFLVMDLDDFKQINDNYGHQAGDRALQKIAAVLRNATRPYDICVRYAGDEFIIVLPGCSAEEADNRVRDLQASIEAVHFEARPGRTIPLSMSAGAAIYPVDGGTYESLLAIADARMYRDKTRRKKERSRAATAPQTDSLFFDIAPDDIQKSALGIL